MVYSRAERVFVLEHYFALLLFVEHNIEQTVANIDPQTLRKVARNTLKREDACLREGGGHFQHLL
jgi:hypothetical protein